MKKLTSLDALAAAASTFLDEQSPTDRLPGSHLFKVVGYDKDNVKRVFGYGPVPKRAMDEALQAGKDYLKKRPDISELHYLLTGTDGTCIEI